MAVCSIRALHDRLPTSDRSYGTHMPCYLCNEELESIQHLFYKCQYSFDIWSAIRLKLGLQPTPIMNLSSEADYIKQRFHTKTYGTAIARLAFRTVIWAIWRERNLRRHKGKTTTKEKLLSNIIFQVNYQLFTCKWAKIEQESFVSNWS